MLAPRFPRGIDVVDLSALLLFAGALLIAAGSPGPSIAALVARVVTAGWRGVLPFIAAMWIGEAIWLSLAVWGLAAVAESLHLLFTVIKYAGVAYLLYLAWRMRSEEHTSELQSLMRISYAVFCLKKKKTYTNSQTSRSI